MFRLRTFPAADGDCLLLSFGDAPPFGHVLIDGGRAGAYRSLSPALAEIARAGEAIDLLVLSHIDADHIEGFLSLARDPARPAQVRDVWYNGFDQLPGVERLGPRQGDRFSAQIASLGWPWNSVAGGGAIAIDAGLPNPLLLGDLKLTLLSPDVAHLRRLAVQWRRWRTVDAARREQEARQRRDLPPGVEALGPRPPPRRIDINALAAAVSPIDDEAPNGSSIAFVAEWNERRVLLSGDAHPDLLAASLRPLAEREGGRFRVELLKVSHHGSRGNTDRALIELLDCRRFLFSTNGSHHGHPDPEAVARCIAFSPPGHKQLFFNYRSPWTRPWNERGLPQAFDYEVEFPNEVPGELTIDV